MVLIKTILYVLVKTILFVTQRVITAKKKQKKTDVDLNFIQISTVYL